MGKKIAAPRMFYELNLEDFIPHDHLLRVIEQSVDLTFVRNLVQATYAEGGRPSTDPTVLFKMALIGFLYGIASERRLAEEVRLNLAFRWFLGYDLDEIPPEHTALSKARTRFGAQVYEAFFNEIVKQCQDAGLIQGNELFIDSTLLKTNASWNSVVDRPVGHTIPSSPSEYVKRVWQDNPEENDGTPNASDTSENRQENSASTVSYNARRVSRTDPDASIVIHKSDKVPFLAYKVHGCVDGGSHRIVTAISTTTGTEPDYRLLPELLAKHSATLQDTPEHAVADKGCGVTPVYQHLGKLGISAVIPPKKPWCKKLQERLDAGFRYDPTQDVYRCPAGKVLYRCRQGVKDIVYKVHSLACQGCVNQGTLCKAKRPAIKHTSFTALSAAVSSSLASPDAQALVRRRKAWIETIWGEVTGPRGLSRARLRGLAKVHMDALLAITVHNIRQLAK